MPEVMPLMWTAPGMAESAAACSSLQVLQNHVKGDVFDMVKNLHLPVEHGSGALLKKLQALGLHSNRYANTHNLLILIFSKSF